MNRRRRASRNSVRARGKRTAAGPKPVSNPSSSGAHSGRRRESGRTRHVRPGDDDAWLVSRTNPRVPPLQ